MLLPALLPTEFGHYSSAENATRLLRMLVAKPADFVLFFEYACEDETWSEQNLDFMQNAAAWLTDQFIAGTISMDFVKQCTKAIRSHFQILRSCIPQDIMLVAEKKQFPTNSLLVASSSDFFYEFIKLQWQEKRQLQIKMKGVSSFVLHPMVEFMETGNVEGLWKFTQDELMCILRQAAAFELSGLIELCEACLKRYLTEANVIDYLKTAHQERWRHLQQSCFNLINSYKYGIQLTSHSQDDFSLEFTEYTEASLSIFESLKMLVTHLICSSSLTESQIFSEVINKCPNLISLDISRTRDFSECLYDIPQSVQELDLSMCGWLNDALLKKMIEICPYLRRLRLTSNTGITYQGWGELQKFSRLIALDISHCNQVSDEDFQIILSSCKSLAELGLEECKKLTEKAFFELAHKQSGLVILNLARCNVTDAALIEIASRCTNLISLDLSRCKDLTDRGVIQAVKYLSSLQQLKFVRGNLSLNAINEIKKLRPKIITSQELMA